MKTMLSLALGFAFSVAPLLTLAAPLVDEEVAKDRDGKAIYLDREDAEAYCTRRGRDLISFPRLVEHLTGKLTREIPCLGGPVPYDSEEALSRRLRATIAYDEKANGRSRSLYVVCQVAGGPRKEFMFFRYNSAGGTYQTPAGELGEYLFVTSAKREFDRSEPEVLGDVLDARNGSFASSAKGAVLCVERSHGPF